jgi:hypothetical protein
MRRALAFVVALGAGLPLLGSEGCRAETLGVRHRIDVIVSAEPNSPLLEHQRGSKGSVSFSVRLSANSKEARFFGVLSPVFSDITVPDGAATVLVKQTKLWEEATCHQRRGLPKVTVTQLKASFGTDGNRIDVSAINRHIGLRVPADELTPGMKLDEGADDGGIFYAVRAQSKDSRLNVDLKIYPIDCFL